MKLKKMILVSLGIGLFVFLVAQVGLKSISHEVARLKWNFLSLIAVYALVYVFDTLGWFFGFKRGACRVGFHDLYWVRAAGEAVNNTTPTGYVGGEPVKALLLKRYGMSVPESLASLVIAKTTMTLSEILFIFMGLGVAFFKFDLPISLRIGMIVVLILLTVLMIVFMFFQQKGLFSGLVRLLVKFKIGKKYLACKMEKIHELEKHLSDFYRHSKKRFFLSFLFHFIGWIAGILEIYIIIRFLGIPLGLLDAFVIEALHQLVRGLAFAVPANLGTQEGGNLFIFTLLGSSAVVGLSVSLVRRIRELTWSGMGWGYLLLNQKLNIKS